MLWRSLRRPSAEDPFAPRARGRAAGGVDPEVRRLPRPRRGLPDSRAVVGGLLVASAALGTWWISAESGRTPPMSYVIATRQIDPGQRIETDDLRLAPMALPPSVAAGAFTRVSAVAGSVALGPIGEGGLVQGHVIVPSTGTHAGREISFAVETPWAVDGVLRPGDRIDVFATSASEDEHDTTEVLSGALVRHVSNTGGGLGETTGLTITVAVSAAADLDRAVSALRAADLTVVRATGVTTIESPAPDASPADRGDPVPRSTTTTSTPAQSSRSGRAVTTTTVSTGAGR